MRILLCSLLVLVATACAVSGGKAALGTVALKRPPNFHSLGKVVTGQACSSPLSTDDYRKAALAAIAQVPGANALAGVKLASRETMSGGFCLRVTGTAGVLR